MKTFIQNLKINHKLGTIVTFIGVIALFGIGSLMLSSFHDYSRSKDLNEANKASDYILMAAGQQALERGITATVLSNPEDVNTYSKIKSVRQKGDEYLDTALEIANIFASKNVMVANKLSRVESIKNKRDDLRRTLDQILTKSVADTKLISSWIDSQTELIMRSNDLAKSLFISDNKLENVLEFNSIVKNAIFYASEFAGRERAEIGALIGNNQPIEGEQLNNLMRYRGVVEENLRSILELKENSNITATIKNAIDEMENSFLVELERTRESVYTAGLNNEPYHITTSEWIQQSTAGINSILNVSETVSKEAQHLAEEQSSASIYSLLLTGLLLLVLVSVLFISVWISKFITQPVNNLAISAIKVSEGDLNQTIEYNSKDEIGQLSSAFNKMIENLRKAYNDLHSEKESVEKKVEEAVRESEEQKNYLERSVRTILTEMDKFAEGDLTVNLEKEKDDIIGSLFTGFNKVVANIRMMIEKVTEAVSATASASSQISSSSEEMAAGAQEQSAQAGEIASAVQQMTSTILETTKNASQANQEAKSAGDMAAEGGKVVQDTVNGMNRIAEVVSKAADTVKDLGKSSDKIGEIIQVIDDIADQTNLLALNAAIEAARAGEQGRGFAVVADEVRKLAERTTKATKEIASMISSIQKETGGAVESMEEGTAEVEKGRELANQAGEALRKIIESSKSVVDVINQVASASEEQSSAAEQISQNIEAISSVTQQSAAGTQQIARAAEDLNRLTDNLQNLITRFRISSSSSSPTRKPGEQTHHKPKHAESSSGNGKGNGRLVYS